MFLISKKREKRHFDWREGEYILNEFGKFWPLSKLRIFITISGYFLEIRTGAPAGGPGILDQFNPTDIQFFLLYNVMLFILIPSQGAIHKVRVKIAASSSSRVYNITKQFHALRTKYMNNPD